MGIENKPKTLLFFLILLFLFAAAFAYGQIHKAVPGPSMDMVNMQQIQALRAELAKLRVELIACHDELNQVRKQLDLCEKGALDKSEKSGESKKKNSETTPAP